MGNKSNSDEESQLMTREREVIVWVACHPPCTRPNSNKAAVAVLRLLLQLLLARATKVNGMGGSQTKTLSVSWLVTH